MKHGHGVFTWANGNKYDGEWAFNKQHDFGIFTWANGSRYEGEYKDGKKHGRGVYTLCDGGEYVCCVKSNSYPTEGRIF